MAIDDRLAMAITHSDGRVTRWGPDEPDAPNIPDGLTFSKSIPGGDKDCTFSLPRRIDLEYADLNLGDDVRIYGPGGQTVWRGRMSAFPRSHGDNIQITPTALGWAAHLRDFTAFREIYVDRDLNRWRPISVSRRALFVGSNALTEPAIKADTAESYLVLIVDGEWLAASPPIVEAWYDAGPGLTIAYVAHSWARDGLANSANWIWRFAGADNETSTAETGSDLQNEPNATGSGQYTPGTPRRYIAVQFFFNAAAANSQPGVQIGIAFSLLAAYGNHGLTIHESDSGPGGFYASDIIENAVSRCAPQLDTSGIETTDFVIPHCTFLEPVTAEEVIVDVNKFHSWEWGVYDKTFFFREPDPDRLTWEARLDQGAKVDLEGDSDSTVWNGAIVTFTDASGTQRTVGPPAAYWPGGVALSDYTDASLVDTSSDNPWNQIGIQRWAPLPIPFPTNQAGATAAGVAYLLDKSLPQRRGRLILQGTGSVEHPTRGFVPVWEVQAGDYIRLGDHPASVPRRIVECQYDHSTRTLSATLDNTSAWLAAILERVAVGGRIGVAF